MNIIIARDNQTFGPYTRDQVEELVEQGELSSEDLASWEGIEEWCPLTELLVASLSQPEKEDQTEETGGDDDFDHEKMKQWEDVFVDDEEGFEDDEQFVDELETQDDFTPPPPAQSIVSPSPEIPHERVVPPPAAAPPPAPIDTTSFVDESIPENHLPPPPPPPPASAPNTTPQPSGNREQSNPQAREKAPSNRPSPITPRSKKIRGLNSGQTVIVVKSSSIFSKLYTISLIFLILSVLSYLVAFVLVNFWPDDVGPKLERVGIPLEIFGHEVPSSDQPAPSSAPPSSDASDSSNGEAEKSNTGTK